MTATTANALDVARAYFDAMAAKDVDTILSLCADAVVCTSPRGQITGLEHFRAFHSGFADMIVQLRILAVHGDQTQATLVYEVQTHPVPHCTVAELIEVQDGKLVSTVVIYDAAPFAAYQASLQAH